MRWSLQKDLDINQFELVYHNGDYFKKGHFTDVEMPFFINTYTSILHKNQKL